MVRTPAVWDDGRVMTSAPPASGPADVRRASRDAQQPVIGGVASGLARHATGTTIDINGASYVR